MHAFFEKDNIQAQSRDALHWALYLNDEEYEISGFYFQNPDERVVDRKNIKFIKVPRNYILKNIYILFYFLNPKYSHVLLSARSHVMTIFLKIKKLLKTRKKIYISLVNRLPYQDYTSLIYNDSFIQFGISRKICEDFEKITGRKIPLVHLLYDLNKFKPIEFKAKRDLVVCVGSHQIRKNPFLFANIAKKYPMYEFVWVGDGYYRSWIQEKKEKENIYNLKLVKKMHQDELAEFLSNAKLFLFPSVHEGFPNVIVEAMACGLPVIAMSTFGPEAVEDGFNGYVVDDEFEMFDKVKYLLENENLLEEMSKNSRKRAHLYTGKTGIKEFEALVN